LKLSERVGRRFDGKSIRKNSSSLRKLWKPAAGAAHTVSRTEQSGRDADQDSTRYCRQAASSYTKEFLFHQSNNERQLLAQVEKALERVREGTFGECIACEKEINAKRLDAVPWTRHCIECQEKLDRAYSKSPRSNRPEPGSLWRKFIPENSS